MKLFNKFLTYFSLYTIAILMGCTKDVDIQDRFNFEFEAVIPQEGFVYESSPIDIKIKPDNIVRGTTYRMSFKIVEGECYIETYLPTIKIVADEEYIMPENNEQTFKFYPTKVGLNKIILTIKDSNGLIKTKEISFVAKLAPFVYLLTPNLSSYTINKGGAMTVTVLKQEDITFQFNYVVEGGTGVFFDGPNAIPVGTPYAIKHGVKELKYVPSTLGTHKIISTMKAPDGATIERIVNVIVDNVPFTLSATASSTTLNVNQEAEINIDLSEQQQENVTYEITHSFDSSGISGVMKNPSNTVVVPGVFNPITPGNYKYKFKPNSLGTSTITFKVKDSNGQMKTATIVIVVSNVQFTFTAVATEKNILLNQNTNLNFNLVPNTTDSNGLVYTYLYEGTSGDGILINENGVEINKGTPISVNKGAFTYRYKPTTLGTHALNFTVTDNNGETRSASIEMTAGHTPVTFNISSVTQTYVNQSVDIDFVITPQTSQDLTYQMNYYISGGSGKLLKNGTEVTAGTYAPVNKGNFKYNFVPSIAGNYTFTFELKDSNNQIVTKNLVLVVINNDFTFTPTQSQKVFVNETNIFSYALVPTGNYSNITYSISYTLEAGQMGKIIKDGTEVQQGVPFNVIPTSFNLSYRPTTVGTHKINYIITDSNGLSKTVSQTVIVTASGFSLRTQQANATIYKNTNDAILLSLSQEQINPNITYTLTYTITGVGQVLSNGTVLANSSIITPGNHSYTFNSSQSGSSQIIITVTDSNGTTHSSTINYVVTNPDFNLSTVGDGSLYLGKSKEFNVFVSQVVPDPTATYQVRYLIESGSTGSGTISKGATSIPFGIFQDIGVGGTTLIFSGTQSGEVKLKVEVKDSNGVVKSSNLIFIVNQINFIFSGAPQDNTIFVNGTTPINFDITESAASGTSYEMKYAVTEGNAQIKNGSAVENANQYYPVSTGSFNRTFIGTTSGTIKVLFTVRNLTTLVEKTQLVTIVVNSSVFTFTATGTNNNQTVGTPINVNFNLVQTGGGNDTYSMVFTSSKTGIFTYGGTTYTAGQVIPITVGSSNGSYKGTVSGTHDIVFTVTNNNGIAKSSPVSLTYINNDFTLSTSGDGSLNVNTNRNFNVYLSQFNPDPAITYHVKYAIASGTTGNGEISIGGTNVTMATYQPISLGTTALTFKGTAEGIVNIEVTVKDSNNLTHTSTLAFNVLGVSYTFTGAPQDNIIFVNGTTPINFDITETSPSDTSYEMKYTVTEGNAQIKNGSAVQNANQYYPVSIGSFNRTFVGTTSGTIKVLFTVRNTTTLVEKTQLVTIIVNTSVFTFNATGTNNNQIVGTPVNVNFNLVQTGGSTDTYSMVFTSSKTGTFTYGGTTYTAGQVIPITVGSSNGNYTGSVSGTHDIVFTVTNNNGIAKSSPVSLTYINNDFTLSTSGDGSLNINTTKNFNVFLSQFNADPAITYQVKYTIGTGTVGSGEILINNTNVALGTFQPIVIGTTAMTFKGTAEGIVNIEVTVKDSNNLTHTSILVFNVREVIYTFTGAPQDNSIFVNGTTPLNFEISENFVSGNDYEMKYTVTEGNAQIKNGSSIQNANQYYPVAVGIFNRSFTGTSVGNVKVLFTVRNKITLAEKTQLISIVVNSSAFSFTAVRTNNGQVVNTPVTINLNLTQTGGTGDTYTLMFTSSSTGTFTYNGITYTAGQMVPIAIGASSGEYIGSVSGEHNISFTVTNQFNISKTANVSLNYINNDFTLSSAGDGSMFINQNKNINVFLSQLIPDPAIGYQVKYSFDSGTVGNGTLKQGGTLLSLGQYQNINLGSTALVFNATQSGLVNLLIEVKNSNGLLKSSVVAINIINAEFTFIGASQSTRLFINGDPGDGTLNFDVTEAATSGTNYQMSFTVQSGIAQVKNGGVVQNPSQWYDITPGAFQRQMSVSSVGNITIVFSVRNLSTLQIKTVSITVEGYRRPTFTNVRTGVSWSETYFCQGGTCREFRYLFSYNPITNTGATVQQIVLTIYDPKYFTTRTFTMTNMAFNFPGGYHNFALQNAKVNDGWGTNNQFYNLIITDSNGVTNSMGPLKWTDSETDYE